MRSSKPFIKNRNKLGASKPIFVPNLVAGNSLKDVISQTGAVVSISGSRYGIVNGVVAQFAANVPPIEDKGLRGCPSFTQLVTKTRTLSDASWEKANGATISGVNKIIYPGAGVPNAKTVEKAVTVPGGTASKVMTLVARVSADTYPQVFRLKNTHGAVVDNFSPDITITSPTDLFFRIVNGSSAGNGEQIAGITPATTNAAFEIYAEINLAEANFIYPYTPNDTTSSVSVVSEAATATTGTSFDLDLATLSRLKTGLRGPNAQGHIELEFESNVNDIWFPYASSNFDINLLTNNDAQIGLLFFRKSIVTGIPIFRFRASSTEYVELQSSISVGQTFKISLDYGTYTDGTQKLRLTVNGVKSSVAAFSGSFGTQDLRFFYGNTVHVGWIKNVKYYERPRW